MADNDSEWPDELEHRATEVADKATFVEVLEAFRADLVRELARPEGET
jgi:hypothetical protein